MQHREIALKYATVRVVSESDSFKVMCKWALSFIYG